MAKNLNRRKFIKIMGAGSSAVVASSSFSNVWDISNICNNDKLLTTSPFDKTPTYCEICFWKCAGWVHQKDGLPWKITGNNDDPNSNGRFCPRGTGGIGMYTDPDRLKTPLIRVEKNGKQTFRKASWDEALTYIAKKLDKIKKEHGPECVALFTHGSGG